MTRISIAACRTTPSVRGRTPVRSSAAHSWTTNCFASLRLSAMVPRADGKWYSAWSTDGCNGTNQWGPTPAGNLKKLPCKPGGQLELLVSDALHGSKANWKQLPPMFTTNATKSGALTQSGVITGEFVTSGYFGE